jgi:hypothetical protein
MEKGSSKFNSKVIYREEYSMHFQVKSAFYRYLEFTLSCRVWLVTRLKLLMGCIF